MLNLKIRLSDEVLDVLLKGGGVEKEDWIGEVVNGGKR